MDVDTEKDGEGAEGAGPGGAAGAAGGAGPVKAEDESPASPASSGSASPAKVEELRAKIHQKGKKDAEEIRKGANKGQRGE